MTNKPISETALIKMARTVLKQHPEILTYRHFTNVMRNALKHKTVDYVLRDNVCHWVYWGETQKELRNLKLQYRLKNLQKMLFGREK